MSTVITCSKCGKSIGCFNKKNIYNSDDCMTVIFSCPHCDYDALVWGRNFSPTESVIWKKIKNSKYNEQFSLDENMNSENIPITYLVAEITSSMFEKIDGPIFRSESIIDDIYPPINKSNRIISCLNPTDQAVFDRIKNKFEIEIDFEIPDIPPPVILKRGDSILILSIQGHQSINLKEIKKYNIQLEMFRFTLWECK